MTTIEQPFEFGTLNEDQMHEVTANLGVTLPQDYAQFLLDTNGGYPVNTVVPLPKKKQAEVQYFLAMKSKNAHANLEKAAGRMKGRIPEALLPIAINSGGDYYCLGIEGERTGKVYLWRHDTEAEDDGSNYYKNVTEVAPNFTAFFEGLLPEE